MSCDVGDYMAEHHRCAVCHDDGKASWNPIECHHIQGRRGRGEESWNDHRNLLAICRACHAGVHGDLGRSLSLGQILTAKREEDGEVDVPFLASLKGRVGLHEDEMSLPDWVEAARIDNRTAGWWRKK